MNKTWGTSIRRYIDHHVQVEEINVVRGGYSSIHRHDDKINVFLLASGIMEVRLYRDDLRPEKIHTLSAGVPLSVMPGTVHQFFALTDCIGHEFYYSVAGMLNAEDIHRYSENGISVSVHAPTAATVCCSLCNAVTTEYEFIPIANAQRPICYSCRKVNYA
jgi:hypothetical protein